MISRDALLGMEWIAGQIALFLGTMGQVALAGALMKSHMPGPIGVGLALVIVFPPWVIVVTTTVFRRPILSPRAFRFCLLFAMGWFALVSIAAEVSFYVGCMPPESPAFARTLCRVLMHVGWLSFIPLIRLYRYTLHDDSDPGV
jgi:hypothetical protein